MPAINKSNAFARDYAPLECLSPGFSNDTLPTLTEEQARIYVENEKIAARIAHAALRRCGVKLPDHQFEDVLMQSEGGFMRGIAGFRGEPEDVKPVIQYAALCAKRAVSRRVAQYARAAKCGVRRIVPGNREDGASEIDGLLAVTGRACSRDAGDVIAGLGKRERALICAKFGIGREACEPEEFAAELGLEPCEAVRMYRKSMDRLRSLARAGAFD